MASVMGSNMVACRGSLSLDKVGKEKMWEVPFV